VYQQLVHTWNSLPTEYRRRVRTSIHVGIYDILLRADPTARPSISTDPTPYDAAEVTRIMAEPVPVATLPPRPVGPLVSGPVDVSGDLHLPGVWDDAASVAARTQAAADGSGGDADVGSGGAGRNEDDDADGSSGRAGRNEGGVVDRGASSPAALVRYLFSRGFSPADRCLLQPSPSLPPADESFSAVLEDYSSGLSDVAGPDDDPADADDLTDPDDVVPPGRRLRPRH
jgi:hypothetical protein